jgi:hypothetical protein
VTVGVRSTPLPLPDWHAGTVAVAPPSGEAGYWSGAPSAVLHDGTFYLAYRLRRPLGRGRGYANVIARSLDGETFETICVLDREGFGAESLERPALVVTPEGRWRLYVSCAVPDSPGWWVDLVEADDPADFDPATRRTVLPGDARTAVKDPVVLLVGNEWHLWASCHPLDIATATDRMTTCHATSPDGVAWTWQGTALDVRPGLWDSRGVRISAVVAIGDGYAAYYDGRASAAQNWEEVTGIAVGSPGNFTALGDEPAVTSPYAPGGLRYLSAVPLLDGGLRLYYEGTREDGSHELRTQVAALAE